MCSFRLYLRILRLLCLSALVLSDKSLGFAAFAQEGPRELTEPIAVATQTAKTPRQTKALRVDVDLVLVPVSVIDSMNRPVTNLKQQNFQLYEDNRLQQIRHFSLEDSPISVGLLLDLSKSMSNKFAIERAAVEEFFKNANPQDDYFVVTFADQPRILASSTQSIDDPGATQSIEDIQQSLASDTPDGHTALLDAVYLATTRMRSAHYARHALLLVTDGGDNHSRYGLKDIKGLVEEANVEVYAIGIFDSLLFRSFEEFMGRRWLSEITDASGGRTVGVTDLAGVPGIAAALSREMRSQYVLGYRPLNPAHDGKWRKIRVVVSPPPGGAHVQTFFKKGYFAPSQ